MSRTALISILCFVALSYSAFEAQEALQPSERERIALKIFELKNQSYQFGVLAAEEKDPVKNAMLRKQQREVLDKKYVDKSRIWLDWRKGLLYFEAGFNYEAFESLRAAREQAMNQFETGLQKAIEADIAKLERQV
jgi:hypothetical protein